MRNVSALKRDFYNQYLHIAHLVEYATQLEPLRLNQLAIDHALDCFPKNLSSVHVIDCIGRHGPLSSASLARRMRMSKSNMTKISNQLLEDGLIEREYKPGNRKESYFSLTATGVQVFDLHAKLHQAEESKFLLFLDEWNAEQLQTILHFLNRLGQQLEERVREGETKA